MSRMQKDKGFKMMMMVVVVAVVVVMIGGERRGRHCCSPHFTAETTETQRGYLEAKSLVFPCLGFMDKAMPTSFFSHPLNLLLSLKQVLTEFSGGPVLLQP